MAGIGDAWGEEEELLHPRGPDGRWISAGGIAKNIIGKVLDFLRSFRPRNFQSQGQAAQYLQNVATRQGAKRMGRPDHIRLLHDLGPANADLRDGVIDEPSTQKFVQMMDRTATELPDDVILTRVVGVDAFGFTPETAKGVDADTPGIRGMSGKLVADRGYGLTTIGNLEGTAPQGTVRMVIAAKKGTKVTIPAASPGDSTVLLHRDQPLRVTKVAPDGAGGWTMYVTADDTAGVHEVPEPIGGPIGVREPSKAREARIKGVTQAGDKRRGVPDEQADLADAEARRQKAAEGQQILAQEKAQRDEAARQQPATGTPTQTSGPPPRQPAPGEPPPRTEPVVGRVGEAPAAGQPAGVAPATGVPEPTPTPRAVDLKLAVRDAGVQSPQPGAWRRQWNEAYLGVTSGKKDPIDAVRELDSDIATMKRGEAPADRGGILSRQGREATPEDIQAFEGLRDVIAQQYGLPEREKAAPAKKAAKKAAPSGMTPEQETAVIDRATQFRGHERNEEETRIVRQADEILARRSGAPTPVKAAKAPAAKKVAPAAPTKAVPTGAPTTPEIKAWAKENGFEGRPGGWIYNAKGKAVAHGWEDFAREPGIAAKIKAARKAAPEAPGDPLDKMTKAELFAEAERRGMDARKSWSKAQLRTLLSDEGLHPGVKIGESGHKEGPIEPVKKAAKKAAPALSDQETRLREILGSEKKPTVAELRAYAKEHKIQVTAKDRRDDIIGKILARNDRQDQVIEDIGANPEDFGRPAKKAAKAAVPGAAPGTAAGKITAGRLKAGDKVLVTQNDAGDWVPSTRKTGQTTLTVESIGQGPGRAGFRRTTTRVVLKGRDENGNEITVTGVPGHQTFIAVPEPDGAPAKVAKAVAPAAPKRMTIGEARRLSAMQAVRDNEVTGGESHTWEQISRNVESGEWSIPKARQEAKRAARYWREHAASARGNGRATPEQRQAAGARLDAVSDKYDKLAEDLLISQSVTKTDKFMRAPDATPDMFERLRSGVGPQGHPGDSGIARMIEPGPDQDHQVKLDRVSAYGDLGTMVDELHANEAGPEATASRLRSKAKQQNIPEEDIAPLIRAAEAGDRQKVLDGARALMRREGVEQIGTSGDTVPLDPTTQTNLTRGRLPEGTTHVVVVRPGSRSNVDGEDILIERATVLPATPDEARAAERATTLVPEGSVPGPRADVPVDNAPRRKELRKAMLDADLPPASPGSGRKSQEEIKGDLVAGRISPEDAVRRFESEISFTDEDLTEVDAHLREGDLNDVERARLQRHRAQLQATRDSHAKHVEFLREYTKEEAPVHGLDELKAVDPVSYEFLEDSTTDDLREAAKQAGLDPPNGDTPDEMFTDLLKQVARRELERRAAKKATKAVKAAKKAAPEAPPTVPREKEKLDARLIGAGIDFGDDKWTQEVLNEVQRALDGEDVGGLGKDPTPAAIGRYLDERATRRMTTAVYEHGQWHHQRLDDGIHTPEENAARAAEDKAEYDRVKAETDKVRELGKRLEKTRRRPVKKAAPVKAAPEVQAAEAKVDNLEARIIDDHLQLLSQARTKEQGHEALQGLTMVELRRLGAHSGIKGRNKQELRDALVDRFVQSRLNSEAIRSTPGLGGVPEAKQTTPPVRSLGIRVREAGIERPIDTLSGVDSAIGEADRRLKGGEDPTAVARFLRERAGQVAKADLHEEESRFKVSRDMESMKSLRKQSAEYLRRVATHVQQEKKAQTAAKKAAPAKGVPTPTVQPDLTDAERAAEVKRLRERARIERELAGMRQANNPRGSFHHNKGLQGEKDADRLDAEADALERAGAPKVSAPAKKAAKKAGAPSATRTGTSGVTGEKSTAPILENTWGGVPGPVHFHRDGIIGQGLQQMGDDQNMDVDGEPLANVVGKLATDAVMGRISQEELIQRLKALGDRLPAGSAGRRRVEAMAKDLDAPERAPLDLPDGTPKPITDLMQELSRIPLARGTDKMRQRRDTNEMDTLQDLVAQARERYPDGDLVEARRARWLEDQLRQKILNQRHESEEGKFQIDRAVREAMKELEALVERTKRIPAPSAPTKKAARLTAIPGGGTGKRSKGTRPKLTVVRNDEGGFSFALIYEEEAAHV